MAINVTTPRCTTIVVNDMETIDVEVIFGSGEQCQKWCQCWVVWILTLSKQSLAPIKALVIEFYFSYKPKAKSGMVGGRKIIVDAQVLNEVMHLPIFKIEIENFKDNSAKHESHFKCQEKSKTPTIGWRVEDENDPLMMEWVHFFSKRLALKLHPTYVTIRQLQEVVATHKGLMFNWVEFVYGQIHEELVLKRRPGRWCHSYVGINCPSLSNIVWKSQERGMKKD